MNALKLFAILCVLSLTGVAYGQGTATGSGDGFKNKVAGSKHDMRMNRRNSQTGQYDVANFTGATALCEFCHTPHKYSSTNADTPLLWNIRLRNQTAFNLYSSPSFEGLATQRNPIEASPTKSAAYYSLLCLGCHDGTVEQVATTGPTDPNAATNGLLHTPSTIGTATGRLSGRSLTVHGGVAIGLANDHPVSFTYSVALAQQDGGLQLPAEGAGVRIARVGPNGLPLFKDHKDDPSGRLECATCHNPHDYGPDKKFLRMGNAGSAMCLNCHGQ